MDPNESLRQLRLMVSPAAHGNLGADEFAEAFMALDQWLSGGGFLPADWTNLKYGERKEEY